MGSRKLAVAQRIAEAHFSVEPNLRGVYLLEPIGQDDDDEPIKLLEVVEGSLANDIFPVGFEPNPGVGIPYRSVVIEVTPGEWTKLKQTGSLSVRGRQWTVGAELHAPTVAA